MGNNLTPLTIKQTSKKPTQIRVKRSLKNVFTDSMYLNSPMSTSISLSATWTIFKDPGAVILSNTTGGNSR